MRLLCVFGDSPGIRAPSCRRRFLSGLILVGLAASLAPWRAGRLTPFIERAHAIDNTLVARWGYDAGGGPVEDQSGHGHDGTLIGSSALFSGGPPFVPDSISSYDLDGVPDVYTAVPHHADFNADTITLSAWVKPDDVGQTGGAAIICKGTGGGGETWCLDVYEGRFRFFSTNGDDSTLSSDSAVAPQWTHVAATYDGSTQRIYINGRLEASVAAPALLVPNAHEVSIGCRQSSSAGYDLCFSGLLDDVRVYDGALSAEEITGLAYQGIVGYWAFEEGSGDVAADASEYGNDAALPDGFEPAWVTDVPPAVYAGNQYALQFDGSDYVTTATGGIVRGQGELSVSAWVKVDEYQTQRAVFSNYTPSGHGLLIETGTVGNDVLIAVNDGATNPFAMTATDVYGTGDWHLWTVAYDGGGAMNEDRLKFYIDGVEQALTFHNSIPSTVGESAKDLTFGASLDDEERYFIGAIDDIQVFDRALAERDAQWLALYAEAGGGDYDVEDCDDLQDVSEDLEGSYTQIANIDCDGFDFTPIGEGDSFEGEYDGNGYVISNLEIGGSGNGDGSGLFGVIGEDGEVRDVGIVSGSVDVSDLAVGTLAGMNNGTILRSFSRADAAGGQYVGGLVGINQGEIRNAYATGDAAGSPGGEGGSGAGGFAGANSGLISNAYATGTVSGADFNGGFVGYVPFGHIENVFAAGEVRDGGLEGFGIGAFDMGGELENSLWNSALTGREDCGSPLGCTDVTDPLAYTDPEMEPFATWYASEEWYIQENAYPILLWEAPQLYYRFDDADEDPDTEKDSSYSGDDALLLPEEEPPAYDAEDRAPVPGLLLNSGSIVLDGTAQYAYAGSLSGPPSPVMTVCTWLKTSAVDESIAQQGDVYAYTFRINPDGHLLFTDVGDGSIGFHPMDPPSEAAVNDGAWHHACFVKNWVEGTYYVDGVESGTAESAELFAYDTSDLAIGTDWPSDTGWFSGKLDDFRIYGRALAAPEIAALAGAEEGGGTCSLSMHWDFNESSGATVADASGNGVDGTIGGDTPVTWSADAPELDAENPYSLQFTEEGQGVGFSADTGDAFTVSLWIKPAAEPLAYGGTLIGEFPDTALFYDYGEGSGGYVTYDGDGGTHENDTLITPGAWHHIALVNDGGDATFYLDGVADGTIEGAPLLDFNVLGGVPGFGTTFHGGIDEVRVFDTALAPERIAELAGGADVTACAEADLCAPDAHWSFDTADTETDVAPDDSGNGHDGEFDAALSSDVPSIGIDNDSSMQDGSTDLSESPKSVERTFSVSLWIKPATFLDSWANLLSEIHGSEIGLWFSGEGNGADAYKISYYDGIDNQFTAPLSTDSWHHVALINNGSTATLYIDGEEEASMRGVTEEIDFERIGDGAFTGLIDDVRVYDSLLTEDQVATLAEGELSCGDPDPDPVCPALADDADDSVIDGDSCYMFFNDPIGWSDAETACTAAEGGHLVSIQDGDENNTVAVLSTAGGAWIGGSDTALEGTFVWTSGDPFSYTNWSFGEPNDSESVQNCAQIYDDGSWDDTLCDGGHPYVCEAPVVEGGGGGGTATWRGYMSTDWFTADNWEEGEVPDETTDVVIPEAGQYPLLTDDAEIGSLTIEAGGVLGLNGYDLAFAEPGTFENQGTLSLHGHELLTNFTNDLDSGIVRYERATIVTGGLPTGTEYWQLELGKDDQAIVGNWRFQSDFDDSSPAGNHGTAENGATTNDNVPNLDYSNTESASLDGDDDHVSIPDDDSLDIIDALSVSAWVYLPNDVPRNQVILDKSEGESTAYRFVINEDRSFGFASDRGSFYSEPGAVPLSTWAHLGVSVDIRGNAHLYLDGTRVADETGIRPGEPNDGSLILGDAATGGQQLWGNIDEVQLYPCALDGEQMGDLAFGLPARHCLDADVAGRYALDDDIEAERLVVGAKALLYLNGHGLEGVALANEGTILSGGDESIAITMEADDGGTVVYTGTGTYTGLPFGSAYDNLAFNTGLVGYWPFDDDNERIAADASGYGNHGAYADGAGTATEYPPFNFYRGTVLDLSADGGPFVPVDNPIGIPLDDAPYTVSVWVKPDAMGVTQGIVGWGNYGTTAQVNALRLTEDGILAYWWNDELVAETGDLSGEWHHIVSLYDGETRSIYLDGALAASDTPAAPHAVPNAENLTIGRANPEDAEYFDGFIDELRIYARALSEAEIAALASGNQPGIAAGVFSLPADLTVRGDLTLSAGTVDTDAYDVTVGGSWINNGGVFKAAGNAVVLDGTSGGNAIQSGGQRFSVLTATGSAAWTLRDRLAVEDTLTVGAEDFLDANVYPVQARVLALEGEMEGINSFTLSPTLSADTDLPSDMDTTYVEFPREDHLAGYWKFDEPNGGIAADSAGNVADGNVASSPLRAGPDSRHGTAPVEFDNPHALAFNADGQRIDIPDDVSLRPDSFTLSAWVQIDADDEEGAIFSKTRSGACPSWAMDVTDEGRLRFSAGTSSASWQMYSSPLETGDWYHVAATYDAGTGNGHLYVNGESVGGTEGAADPPAYTPAGPLQVGRRAVAGGDCPVLDAFRGALDDLRVYDTAFGEDEIARLWDGKYASGSLTEGNGYTLVRNQEAENLVVASGYLNLGEAELYTNQNLEIQGGSLEAGSLIEVNESVELDGTFIAPPLLRVGEGWHNRGTFDANGGEVEFTGHEVYLEGDTAFHDFTVDVLGTMRFQPGRTIVIGGDMHVHGYAGAFEFRSWEEGERWYIDPRGGRDLSELDVRDSENVNAEEIDCTGEAACIDSGNNVGWIFDTPPDPCGNGELNEGEECDDDGVSDGDGCSNACTVEAGWSCMGSPSACYSSCGAGIAVGAERSGRYGDVCYAFYQPEEKPTWAGAEMACEAGSGSLAIVTSSIKQSIVAEFAEDAWIGLSDAADEGEFAWVDDTSLEYSNWYDNQPNGGTGENCVLLTGDQWHDYPCESHYAYVCQFPDAGAPSSSSAPASSSAGPSSADGGGGGGGGAGGDSGGGGGGGGGGRRRSAPVPLARQSAASRGRSSSAHASAASSVAIGAVRPSAPAGKGIAFRDVPASAWYAPYVRELVELGGISGYQNALGRDLGVFKPEQDITFAEILKVVLKAGGADIAEDAVPRTRSARETWAAAYVAEAERRNASVLHPALDVSRPATRGEVVQTVLELLGIPLEDGAALPYRDTRKTHPHAAAIATATKLGIVSGDAAGRTFRPDDPINRAEAAKMVILALRWAESRNASRSAEASAPPGPRSR